MTPSPASTQFFEGLFSAGGEALGAEGEEEQEDLFLANLRLLSQAAPATSTAEAAGRMTQDSKVSDKAASSGEDSCSAPMLATCVPKVSGAVASLPLDNEVRVSASACATACVADEEREREREREREGKAHEQAGARGRACVHVNNVRWHEQSKPKTGMHRCERAKSYSIQSSTRYARYESYSWHSRRVIAGTLGV